MQKICITKPDDWHIHLRDGEILRTTVKDAAKQFARAIVMPNLPQPIDSVDLAEAYRARIIEAIPKGQSFTPLMTLYLTDDMKAETIVAAKESSIIHAYKLYPMGATTHSGKGVSEIKGITHLLEAMELHDLPLSIHGEVISDKIDVFDKEKVFIEQELIPLIQCFPDLRVIFEHISTKEAVEFVASGPKNLAATITAHHLLMNRNDIFKNGLNPHKYCLPLLKSHSHQEVLIKAATSGNPKFFLGTDSAPHLKTKKECALGCAGVYTAHTAIELYAEVFEKENALDKLEAFASFFGADFYQLPRNKKTITLIKNSWEVPKELFVGKETLVPFRAGKEIKWRI